MPKKNESPVIYELIGLPGSGKTYLSKKLVQKSSFYGKYQAMSGAMSKQNVNLQLKFLLNFHLFFGKPARLYDAWAYEILKNDEELNKKLFAFLKPYFNFMINEAGDKKNLLLLNRALERDFIFNKKVVDLKLPTINDDGILQRLVSIFGLRNNDWNTNLAQEFQLNVIRSLPSNLKVIFTDSNPKEALKRMQLRKTGYPELIDKRRVYELLIRASDYLDFLQELLITNHIEVYKVNTGSQNYKTIKKLVRIN